MTGKSLSPGDTAIQQPPASPHASRISIMSLYNNIELSSMSNILFYASTFYITLLIVLPHMFITVVLTWEIEKPKLLLSTFISLLSLSGVYLIFKLDQSSK